MRALLIAILAGCGGGGTLEDGGDPGAPDAEPAIDRAPPQAEHDAGADAGSPPDAPPPIACAPSSLGPGMHDLTVEHDGRSRIYRLYVPQSYGGDSPGAVVLNFHGEPSNAQQQATFSRMNDAAELAGYLVVYPEGVDGGWNAGGTCCGRAVRDGIDDVGFVRALVADLEDRICIDPERIFATGLSAGGYFAYRLACEASDLVAAIAPVAAASELASCTPSRSVPVLAFHGEEDGIVAYADGRAALEGWIDRDGCSPSAMVETIGEARCEIRDRCNDGAEVGLCSIAGMGHCWPGGDPLLCTLLFQPYSDDLAANERMWSFFAAHPLGGAGGAPDAGATPDAGMEDAGGGACTNAADLAIAMSTDVSAAVETCASGCFGAPSCTRGCIMQDVGLSSACTACYSDAIACTIQNCIGVCSGADSPECQQCRDDSGCTSTFLSCSGVSP